MLFSGPVKSNLKKEIRPAKFSPDISELRSWQLPAVRDPNGQLHSDTRAINNIFKAFYIDLYSSELEVDNEEVNSFLVKSNLPPVAEVQQKILDNPVTAKEIMDAIQKLPNGKAPSSDGFTAKFLKIYVNEISPLLLKHVYRIS